MQNYSEFQFPVQVSKALQDLQFETPTPIQAQSIPVIIEQKDIIGIAQTGTGKTAAFCIPTLIRLLKDPQINALVLAPTRELALQIDGVWKGLTRYASNYRSAILVGGCGMPPQIRALQAKPRLIIATPGRLIDHIQQRHADLSKLGILILDEADRMLDMGFAPQLNQIMKCVPQQRQTLLFTATWGPDMDSLSKKYLKNPTKVSVAPPSRVAEAIDQEVVRMDGKEKNNALLDEINKRPGSVLVFARTKSRTDRVARFLDSYGVEVNRIHGGRTQGQRNKALAEFKAGSIRVLVATDIAARGIDVTKIKHVINYDLPQVAEDYIHRIGRTGRNGETGSAISFVASEEYPQWRDISNLLKKAGSKQPKLVDRMKQA
jgi:superfamily II DNA/RNA helicase